MNIPLLHEADTARHLNRISVGVSNLVSILHDLHTDIEKPSMLKNDMGQAMEVYNEIGQMLDHLNEHILEIRK